jgi:hypothetical protein
MSKLFTSPLVGTRRLSRPYDRSIFYGGDARGYTDYPIAAVTSSVPRLDHLSAGEGALPALG